MVAPVEWVRNAVENRIETKRLYIEAAPGTLFRYTSLLNQRALRSPSQN